MGAGDLGWLALPPWRWDLGQHGNPPSFRQQMGGGGSGLMNAGTNLHGNSENIPEDSQADQLLWRVSDKKSSAFPYGKLHW